MRVRPIVAVLRVHSPLVEEQGANGASGERRDGRPIPAGVAHELQRTVVAETIARSGEPHGGIRTTDFIVEVPTVIPSTVYIEF